MHSKDFTVWVRKSFTGRQKVAFRQKAFPGVPYLGPDGQVAVVGPAGRRPAGRPAYVEFISRSGAVRGIRTAAQSYPAAWGQQAPALVLRMLKGPALAVFGNGRREWRPAGWPPLAWNRAGTQLLVKSESRLGTWSPRHPHDTRAGAATSPGFLIEQASWLRSPARL